MEQNNQAYNAASVLEDMRRFNMIAENQSYAGAIGQQGAKQETRTQQQAYPPPTPPGFEWQGNPQQYQQQQNDGFDFEVDQLASALEFALNDQQQSTPPYGAQSTPQYYHSPPPRQMQGPPPGMHTPPPMMYQHPNVPPSPPQHGFHAPPQMPPPMMMGGRQPYFPGYPVHGRPSFPPNASQVPRRGGLGADGKLYSTSRMSAFELNRLVEQQENAMKTDDPLSDDYYFIKYTEQQAKSYFQAHQRLTEQRTRPTDLLAEMKALLHGGNNSVGSSSMRPRGGPLSKEHLAEVGAAGGLVSNQDILAKKIDKARSDWHDEHKVLGRSVKSNLKRPRELIAQQQTPGSIGGATFQTQTWILRGILGKVSEKLIDIADVHEVMQAKVEAARPFHEGSVAYVEATKMIETLQKKQLVLCNDLGQLLCFPSVIDETTGVYNNAAQVELVGGWDALFFLIWTPKGRQLVLRSIPCLLRPHLRSILKTFCTNCAYFVCRNPDGQDDEPVKDEEAKLDLLAAQTFGEELRQLKDLSFITECLHLTYQVFKQNPAVLSVFVHIPAGQEVIRSLLQQGKQLSQDPQVTDVERSEWNKESDNFYSIMLIAVSNLEKENSA